MRRTPVNPWTWSLKLGFNQAEIIQDQRRELICSGQVAVDAEGNPQHINDMRNQLCLALDNLEAVLAGADMTLANVIRLNSYTTDMDEMVKNYEVVVTRLGVAGVRPPTTFLGVTRLALPEFMVELEATAAD